MSTRSHRKDRPAASGSRSFRTALTAERAMSIEFSSDLHSRLAEGARMCRTCAEGFVYCRSWLPSTTWQEVTCDGVAGVQEILQLLP